MHGALHETHSLAKPTLLIEEFKPILMCPKGLLETMVDRTDLSFRLTQNKKHPGGFNELETKAANTKGIWPTSSISTHAIIS